MIITCPKCDTHYRIDPEVIGGAGREVRCVKCGHAWRQDPEHMRQADAGGAPPPPGPSSAPPPPPSVPARAPERWPAKPKEGPKSAPPPEAQTSKRPSRAQRKVRPPERRRLGAAVAMWLGVLVLVVCAAAIAAYFARESIVQAWPEAERVYARLGLKTEVAGLGLEVRNVTTVRRLVDDARTLEIEGEVVNVSNESRPIPLLRASLKDQQGVELMDWTFDVRAGLLGPGKSQSFRTVADNPPASATDLSISFTQNGAQ
jgi:predicted Zn finger-like uncharacterized protein